ncbi:unnamed protein product [Vitrella brassicaformis CCMP3155]|uniref:Uncharacterized protein n=3 Tax=Vitrella brassicaformis TaxID=1169539 RepID=A0A0G4F7R9_VITBC|nr:unnamed protein product [Vitrella brassicaformis CCMP3155]|eukprot:CEM08575.1 unnamed protein product [Vitrella brassicaformis CCMP3155]
MMDESAQQDRRGQRDLDSVATPAGAKALKKKLKALQKDRQLKQQQTSHEPDIDATEALINLRKKKQKQQKKQRGKKNDLSVEAHKDDEEDPPEVRQLEDFVFGGGVGMSGPLPSLQQLGGQLASLRRQQDLSMADEEGDDDAENDEAEELREDESFLYQDQDREQPPEAASKAKKKQKRKRKEGGQSAGDDGDVDWDDLFRIDVEPMKEDPFANLSRDQPQDGQQDVDQEQEDDIEHSPTSLNALRRQAKRQRSGHAHQNGPLPLPSLSSGSAWHDPDDDNIAVNLAAIPKLKKLRRDDRETEVKGSVYEQKLRVQFQKNLPAPSWVELARQRRERREGGGGEEDNDSDENDERQHGGGGGGGGDDEALAFLRTSGRVLEGGAESGRLPPHKLNIRRMPELFQKDQSCSSIKVVEFHPTSEVLLACGDDQTMRLHTVDGRDNPRLSVHHLKRFKILDAAFEPGGNQVLLTSYGKMLVDYDMQSGAVRTIPGLGGRSGDSKYWGLRFTPPDHPQFATSPLFATVTNNGYVCVVDWKTKQLVRAVKGNAGVYARGVFHPSRPILYTADKEAYIYEWDLGSGRCISRTQDVGVLSVSCLEATRTATTTTTSPSSTALLAAGGTPGIVDIFPLSSVSTGLPNGPIKSVTNLTTEISTLRFHPSCEILAMASKTKNNQLKLLHLPSYTVFQNWPTERTVFKGVTALDFSHTGGYMAVGTDRGRVLLWQLQHYA